MIKEIEKKYRIKDFNEIEKKVLLLGGVLKSEGNEVDIYFNVSGRDSMATKECLRIRSSLSRKEVTYKPPTLEGDKNNKHFAKREINLPIQDVEATVEFLESLGNTLLVKLIKNRKHYIFSENVSVVLDILNDQYFFVEIEVESENEDEALLKIKEVEAQLSLSDEMVETRPYRDIAMGL